jgi:serine/threonine protein kinase
MLEVIGALRPGDPPEVGPYRLLGRLGTGGMGQVFLALSPGARPVAIKLIRAELAEERGFRARFAAEVAAARAVGGAYTAAVIDADPQAELPWMATAYVPGPSLADVLEDSGPLPPASLVALAAGLAEALAAIHAAGVVHRDLKPSNVLLAADGPRVIDFGISRAVDQSMLTTTGEVMGSPGFMSPEQARGSGEIGPASDLFSLGAVLTFAATGRGPFGAGPPAALLFRVVNEPPELTGLPSRLRPLVVSCLAKDPVTRPTPADLLAELREEVSELPGQWLPDAVQQSLPRYMPAVAPELALSTPEAPDETTETRVPPAALPRDDPPAEVPPERARPSATRPRHRRLAAALAAAAAAGVVAVAVTALALLASAPRLTVGTGPHKSSAVATTRRAATLAPSRTAAPAARRTTLRAHPATAVAQPTAVGAANAPASVASSPTAKVSVAPASGSQRISSSGVDALGCQAYGSVVSRPVVSGSSYQVAYLNHSKEGMRVWYINKTTGEMVQEDWVAAGQALYVGTWPGEVYIVTTQADGCLGMYETTGNGTVTVTD